VRLVDTPDFHDEWKPEALSQALDPYQAAAQTSTGRTSHQARSSRRGERTGRYRTAGDQPLAGDNGRSEISMEDFAVALLNEIEQGRHVGQRFTAAW
jgi:uncharacterized protein